MTARELNRRKRGLPELALARGPMPTSRLGSEVPDEAMLLDGYDATSSSWKQAEDEPRALIART